MPTRFLHESTRAAYAAASSQQEQCEIVRSAFQGNVTVRIEGAAGQHLRTMTLGPFTINSLTPRGVVCGSVLADTAVAPNTPGAAGIAPVRWEFRDGSTPIFETGDIVQGPIRTLCSPRFGSVVFTANPALPVTLPPSWYPAVGECVAIPGSTTIGSAVRAMGANSYPGNDPDNIVDPWSGGAIVSVGGQPYLVVMGGGHNDSSFNGIIKYGPLYGAGSNSPSWTPFLAASAAGDVVSGATYLDGRQSSTHTYNNLVGVGDTLYSMRTDAWYPTGNSSPIAFKFTPSGQASIASYPGGGQFNAAAHYNGKIYVVGGNTPFDRLRIYDIAGNSYTSESAADISFTNYVGSAVDSTRGKLLAIAGPGTTESAYWDLSTLARTLNVTRPANWLFSLEYDPDRDAFVSLQPASLTLLEASASALAAGSGATWVGRTFTGPTPPAPVWGHYGRFRYVPELKGYVLAPGLESPVYFFRSA